MSLRDERFIPAEPIPTVATKSAERERVARQVEEYLARGGKISVIDQPKKTPRFRMDKSGVPRYAETRTVKHGRYEYQVKPRKQIEQHHLDAIREAVDLLGGYQPAAQKMSVALTTLRGICNGHGKIGRHRATKLSKLTEGRISVKAMTDE